jgi:hypothetical protein
LLVGKFHCGDIGHGGEYNEASGGLLGRSPRLLHRSCMDRVLRLPPGEEPAEGRGSP